MQGEYINVVVEPRGLVRLTLARPNKHNALNEHVIAQLTAALDQLVADDAAQVLLLDAAGASFSAGADLDWMRRMAGNSRAENRRDANALAQLLYRLNFLAIPTIAKVQGAAMGGACGLLCCCDIAIASHTARFAFSEVRIGLAPATISPYVIRRIGEGNARRYFLTAERFDAAEAQRIGLVSEIIAADKLNTHVDALIDTILANSSVAVRAAKRLVFDIAGKPITTRLLHRTSRLIAAMRASEDGQEGVNAFLEKRRPAWRE